MASIYLDSDDTFTLSGAANVYGGAGVEKLIVNSGATGVTTNATLERVDLAGASSAYTYQQSGLSLKVFSGTTLVATVAVQSDADGSQLVFANGSVSVKLSAAGMTFGGATVPTTAPAAVTPTTIDATVTSGAGTSTTGGTTTGQAFALTNSATADVFALTAGNDTVTGASGTLAATDAVIDTSTADADVMTAQVTVATLAPSITKVETININGDFVTTGLDFANVRGSTTVNFNTGITSGTATVGTTVAGAGAKTTTAANIAFGSNVTTATINADATVGTAGTLNVNAGSVTALTLTGASAVDNYAITTSGNIAFTGSTTAEVLKLIPTVASQTITLDGANVAGNTLDVGGTVAATLKGTAANLTGKTITKSGTGTLTVEVATTGAAAADLSKVAADAVTLSVAIGGNDVTVKSGTTVSTSLDMGAAAFGLNSTPSSASTNAVTFNNTASNQTGLVGTNIKTLTVNSAATAVSGVDATYAVLNVGTNNAVLTGTNDVKVTAGTAGSVDASALVGALTYTQAATAATTIKGGSGANVITLANVAVDASYTGKDGGDTINAVNTTGAVSVTTGSGIDSVVANSITSGALSANLGAGSDTISATALTSGVISATMGAGNDTVTVGTAVTGAAVIVIDGGDGTDVLKVGPAFDIAGGTLSLTSVDSIELTATGALKFSAAQLSGNTIAIKGTATIATDNLWITGVAGTTTLDASTLAIDQTLTKALSNTTLNVSLSTAATTVKGTAVNDDITGGANGNTITAGGGADKITLGAGTDKIVYAATTGAALQTEAKGTLGANATTAPVVPSTGVGAAGNGDIIAAGFAVGTDKIVLSTAFGTAGAVTGLVAAGGTSYTTASAGLAAADFISGTAAAITLTANTAGGGRFYFVTDTGNLYYDASGDTAMTAIGTVTAGAADDFAVATITGAATFSATDFMFA